MPHAMGNACKAEGTSVWVSESAPQKTKDLWWLHGHPHSKRFSDPALTSLSSLLRHNAAKCGNDTAFIYPVSSGDEPEYKTITWAEFDRCTDAIARRYAEQLRDLLALANSSRQQPTVALWGAGFTIEYFATEMALARLNLRVLLLADNTPIAAVTHLVNKTNAQAIIADASHASLYTAVQVVPMVEEPLTELPDWNLDDELLAFEDEKDPWIRQSFIIHSSGSTGLPKPITHTNRSLMQIARMYRLFPEFHIENWLLLFPLFHVAGFSIILSGLPNGLVTTFPPRSWPPRSSAVLRTCSKVERLGHPVECIHTAPMVIESLVEYIEHSGGDYSPLSKLKVLQPGGAMLNASVVSNLVKKGVNVKTTYGSTEIGPPFRSIPHSRDNPECYRLANLYPDNDKIKMEEVGNDLYECVVYNGFQLAAELWDGPEDMTPYRTKDLFTQDPPGSGYFYLTGRQDDVLVHTTGENTNANPIEVAIKGLCKQIRSLVLLGHGRPCTSLLIEWYDARKADTECLWKAVDEVNAQYPRHSTILPSMVYILSSDETLPVTPKGNVKRREAEKVYQNVLDQLYSQTTSQPDAHKASDAPSGAALAQVIRGIVSKIRNMTLGEHDDHTSFSEFGLDSISAIKLRYELVKEVGPIGLGAIFEYSSISRLVGYYDSGRNDGSDKVSHEVFIRNTIESYCQELQTWPVAKPRVVPEKESVLLTGSSGSLGTALLEACAASPRIGKVYALIHGHNPLAKLRQSMQSRGMDFDAIYGTGKIELLGYDMTDPELGIRNQDYDRLAMEVTTVIHGAWVIDFNKTVEDYEKDSLKSVINMIKFCATKQTKVFSFISSIAACMGTNSHGLIPEAPISPDIATALNTGYAQSKYIVERICHSVSTALHLPINILRLGQMYGHTKTGSWNSEEMFPIMLATSLQLGALPKFPGKRMVDWIPVDDAAGTMHDIITARPSAESHGEFFATHNIVNPHPITWDEYLGEVQRAFGNPDFNRMSRLDEISITEWVARLRDAIDKALNSSTEGGSDLAVRIPGSKLLNFFDEMAQPETPSASDETSATEAPITFSTEKSRQISPRLRSCKPVNDELMRTCLTWWRERGFLDLKSLR